MRPEEYKLQYVDVTSSLKHKQHELANYVKRIGKEKFNKGAEGTWATIADNVAIVRSERYLTKIEKYVIESNADGMVRIKELREDALLKVLQEREVIDHIENILDAKIVQYSCDSYPSEESCVMTLVFDRQLV